MKQRRPATRARRRSIRRKRGRIVAVAVSSAAVAALGVVLLLPRDPAAPGSSAITAQEALADLEGLSATGGPGPTSNPIDRTARPRPTMYSRLGPVPRLTYKPDGFAEDLRTVVQSALDSSDSTPQVTIRSWDLLYRYVDGSEITAGANACLDLGSGVASSEPASQVAFALREADGVWTIERATQTSIAC